VITGVLALLAVLVLAFVRVPLGFSMLIVSWVGLGLMNGWDSANTQVPLTITEAVFSYDLAVVPMFILMGNVLSRTGISDDLFRAAYAFLGSVRGGLALSTMVTCAGFSAVCGSSLATAATMSKVAYPSMKRYGYSEELATATIAAGGTLGILIPPSIILMIYGFLTQTNIGHLFIAGVLPGLVGLGLYMCAIMWVALRRPQEAPAGEPVPWPEKLASLRGVWPFALLFFLIIGGLYGAIFTATEAAGMGAGSALIIALMQRRLSWKSFREVFIETAGTSTMLYFVLFGAMLFAKLVAFSGLGEGLVDFMRAAGLGPYGTLFAVLAVFILLGCVMDTMAIILICVPLFLPTLAAHGFDLIWFGVIVVVLTEIGLITPPVGMNVFVLKACLQHVPLKTIFRGLIPFISADIVRLAILISFPSISLALVKMMK
jgi:tripartite ATP-independent transporter DctM subunit